MEEVTIWANLFISFSNLADNIPMKGKISHYEHFHLLFQYLLFQYFQNMSQTADYKMSSPWCNG